MRKVVFDRGPRPMLRGYLHLFAFWYFLGAGTSLTVVALVNSGFSGLSVATLVYALCLAGMLGVSAIYHRFPWSTEGAVHGWRRADHAMIAVFIAGTYGPVFLGADAPGSRVLLIVMCWVLAAVAVALNLLWIDHPRWLSVSVYLCLGWLALFGWHALTVGLTTPELSLIIAGGVIYTLGAVCYALKWPTINARVFGFHEVFHAATIIAAGLHHVAIWMIVLNSG